jgi:molybdate transport system substrate-binding protein
MRIVAMVSAALGGSVVGLLGAGLAQAGELALLSTNGVTAIMEVLGPQFEHDTGTKLVARYDATLILRKEIDAGAAFDVAILTTAITDDLMKSGKLVPGSSAAVARSGIGVAMKAGAVKPDIGTIDAFKRTLLAAKSVAYTTEGASGQYFAGLLQRLGIADAVKAKSRLIPGGRAADLVARGEAELAVQQISELLPVAGTELVGPLPPELQNFTVFSAAIATGAKDADAARSLVKFLSSPEVAPVLKAKGMEPG